MDSKKLEYLLKVEETRSFTEAAKQLYITQSALSQAIGSIEKNYGVEIFTKKDGRLHLTPEGKAIVTAARHEFFQEKNLRHELSELKEHTAGDIFVGLASGRAVQFLPKLLPDMWKRFPHVRIVVSTRAEEGFERAVHAGRVDFAFVMDCADVVPSIRSELLYEPLFSYRPLIAVPPSHPLASEALGVFDWNKRRPIKLNEMKESPFISDPHGERIERWNNAIFNAYQFVPHKMLTISGALTRLDLVEADVGWCITQEATALARCRGIYFRLDKDEFAANLCVICRRDKYLTLPMKYFIELVKNRAVNGEWTKIPGRSRT